MAPQRKTPKPQQQQQQQHNAATNSSAAGPAARTRSAAQQHQRQKLGSADLVLPLLLQHDSVRTQLLLACRLLCCSKTVAAAVAEHSAGQLDMPQFEEWQRYPTRAQKQQAAPWLRKHARLMRSLNLQTCDEHLLLQEGQVEETSGSCVAALLAAGPQTLALQSLKAYSTPATLALLEQLPASRLTHLDWGVDEELLQPAERPAFVARVSAALGRLTALRSLVLSSELDEGLLHQQEVPGGLSSLTQLTSLGFEGPVADLQHVPPQLLELDISHAWRQPGQALELQRLAALTALTSSVVQQGDVLPPNLLRLSASDCRSAQPLLGLQQLQQLELRFDHGAGAGLDQPVSASLPAPGTAQRPDQPAAAAVPTATGWLGRAAGSGPQAAVGLAAAAAALHHRRAPTGPTFAVAGGDIPLESQGMQQLAQAVGGLQHLRGLDLSGFSWLAAMAGASSSLTGLTALTELLLSGCRFNSAAVRAVVSQLPGLQRLDCGDEPLEPFGRLQQLT